MSIASDAALVAALFAVDPEALGGVCLRSQVQPARDQWLHMLRDLLPPQQVLRRAPCNISDDRLLGGLDLIATLNAGRVVAARGILGDADGGVLVVSMAERLTLHTAACLSAVLDSGEVSLSRDGAALRFSARVGIVALDESLADEETVPRSLLDRLCFLVDLNPLNARSVLVPQYDLEQVLSARHLMPRIRAPATLVEAICGAALTLGAGSPRVSLLALRAACAAAALEGRKNITEQDAATAVRLVLVPRATQLPPNEAAGESSAARTEDQEPAGNPGPRSEAADSSSAGSTEETEPSAATNTVLAAAAAAIPKGLLASIVSMAHRDTAKTRSAGRAGRLAGRNRARAPVRDSQWRAAGQRAAESIRDLAYGRALAGGARTQPVGRTGANRGVRPARDAL